MSTDALTAFLVKVGKAQIDAMSRRQDQHAIDDSEFIPLLEVVLNAFETSGVEHGVMEELWQHAYLTYDRACRESDDLPFTSSSTIESRGQRQTS